MITGRTARHRSTWTSIVPARRLAVVILGVLSLGATAFAEPSYPAGTTGTDVSFVQCGLHLPVVLDFAVVGVSAGRAFTRNPCLAGLVAWASDAAYPPAVYMNLNAPTGSSASRYTESPDACTPDDLSASR